MRFLDMFGGIGGFRLGLEAASDDYECVGYLDNDRFAVDSYNEIFGEDHEPRDAGEVRPGELPEFDLVTGGFPCQSFSIAGARQGFEDHRGTLFFEIARLARAKKPEKLLLENVKGLLSAKAVDEEGEPVEGTKGYVFSEILQTLDELGYFISWQVLNSKFFGVPQNRERVFIVGHLGGEPGRKVFPVGGEDGEDLGEDGGEKVKSKIVQKSPDWREDGTLREFVGNSPTIRKEMGDNLPMILRWQNKGGASGNSQAIMEIDRIASRYGDKQAGGVYNPEGIAPMVNYGKRGPMPHHVPEVSEEDKGEIIRLGGLYDDGEDRHQAGSVYDPTGISPLLDTSGGGHREPMIIDDGWKDGVGRYPRYTLPDIEVLLELNKARGVLNHEEKATFKAVSNAVDENYWKGMDKHGQRTHIYEPVHTPDFVDKDENMKSPVGSEDGSMFTVDGTSIHGVLEESDGRGKIRINRDDEKKSEIQGYSTFLTTADYVDLVDNHDKNVFDRNRRIRKLTPRECWRLQGFPDWAFEKAQEVNSDTQLYRQAGNAVTVNVVEAVGRGLMASWLEEQGEGVMGDDGE